MTTESRPEIHLLLPWLLLQASEQRCWASQRIAEAAWWYHAPVVVVEGLQDLQTQHMQLSDLAYHCFKSASWSD